jgi:hypothetical protein
MRDDQRKAAPGAVVLVSGFELAVAQEVAAINGTVIR